MKVTGIVRRVDDLGRIVIPKEVRRSLRIKEGDPLEIFITDDDGVIFKKYKDPCDPKDWADSIVRKLGHYINCIHVTDKVTTVYTDVGIFQSTCHANDTYDFSIGVAVAFAKGFGIDMPDCLRPSR
jgi:AbrB family looped-hinge helix DNA binding protein